ncbi:MAG: hypothetical protein IJB89_08530 [Akkermansia sp.]|nr:hypothetical protein [Akkermansia sp.]
MFVTLSIFAAAAAIFFWQEIAGFLVNTFLPWIREHVGFMYSVVSSLVVWLNKGVVRVRSSIVSAYNWIKTNMLHCSTKYELDKEGNAYSTTVTVINDNGKITGTEAKRAISKWDMPQDVLVELTRNAQASTIDNKSVILNKVEEQAKKDLITLSATN